MKLKHVFLLNAIAVLGYAVGLLIIPATVNSWHGIATDPSTLLMSRFFGVALLSTGLPAWLARNSEESKARDALTLGLLISYIAGLILSVQATLSGQMNALGWLPAALYLVLIIGFGYFRFR
jgi:hypothetical protein